MHGPHPHDIHPLKGSTQICFIQGTITRPNIVVGDYSYYDDPVDAAHFERNVLYHEPALGDRLIIGKFCAISSGVRFIMNAANHRLSGFSTYPFHRFGQGWEGVQPSADDLPFRGDTLVGNDVWIGYQSVIMPGVKIGNGAIIAAGSIVVNDVPPYSVYGGNPAKLMRQRFSPQQIAELERLAWWDWPIERITACLPAIVSADMAQLHACATEPCAL
ncbi:MAG: Virginiamycin acetyltransferase [Pseudomonadota bacterium]|jgi:virginiamycin A acetyltransferase